MTKTFIAAVKVSWVACLCCAAQVRIRLVGQNLFSSIKNMNYGRNYCAKTLLLPCYFIWKWNYFVLGTSWTLREPMEEDGLSKSGSSDWSSGGSRSHVGLIQDKFDEPNDQNHTQIIKICFKLNLQFTKFAKIYKIRQNHFHIRIRLNWPEDPDWYHNEVANNKNVRKFMKAPKPGLGDDEPDPDLNTNCFPDMQIMLCCGADVPTESPLTYEQYHTDKKTRTKQLKKKIKIIKIVPKSFFYSTF